MSIVNDLDLCWTPSFKLRVICIITVYTLLTCTRCSIPFLSSGYEDHYGLILCSDLKILMDIWAQPFMERKGSCIELSFQSQLRQTLQTKLINLSLQNTPTTQEYVQKLISKSKFITAWQNNINNWRSYIKVWYTNWRPERHAKEYNILLCRF